MTYTLPDFIGNVGVALIILAYFGLLSGRLRSSGVVYSLANLAGASLILISLRYTFNLSSFIIELFWIAISLYGLALSFRGRRKN
jgi:hypothetical protein